jgi:orotidine-5'-phosphate decarboxylase
MRHLVLGVTILTSLDDEELRGIGYAAPPLESSVRLAVLAGSCGLRGVVTSPQEVRAIREACGDMMKIVVPGIRPKGISVG